MSTTTLLVRQDQLATTRLTTTDDTPLAEGQVRVRVESFALTANNITYAALGDMLNYWQFFPTGEAGWGIVPVWGFGTVVQSLHPAVAVGVHLAEAALVPQIAVLTLVFQEPMQALANHVLVVAFPVRLAGAEEGQ